MNVQLMLLLALVGPFCAFTHASPTELPTQPDVWTTAAEASEASEASVASEASEAPKEDLTVVTGPPATKPATAPGHVATDTVTEAPSVTDKAEEPVTEAEAPAAASTAAPEPLITAAPAVETAAPPTQAEDEAEPVTAAAEAEGGNEEVIVDDTEEGVTSGQVVGIVIGVLLAVVIVIAVVIAVVRRMGKYSP